MTGYLIDINDWCNQCMECVEVCQGGILTEDRINIIDMLKYFNNHFKVHAFECTYCESCMDVCEQNAIMVTPAEWEELQ